MAMPFKVVFIEAGQEIEATSYFTSTTKTLKLIENSPLLLRLEGGLVKLYGDFLTEGLSGVAQDAQGLYVTPREEPYELYAFGHGKQYPLIAGDYYIRLVYEEQSYDAKLHVAPKRLTAEQFATMRTVLLANARELALIQTTTLRERPASDKALLPLLQAATLQPPFALTKQYPLQNPRLARVDGKAKRLRRQKPHAHLQPSVQTVMTYDIAENRLMKQWLTAYALQQAQGATKQAIMRFLQQPWLKNVGVPRDAYIPRSFFSAGVYGAIYQILQQAPVEKVRIAQDQFKRTAELYELWGFIQLAKITEQLGYHKVEQVITADTMAYTFTKGNATIYMVYDEVIPRKRQQSTSKTPLYTLQNNRPDCRIDLWQENNYAGSLVIDFKYRNRESIWEEAVLADMSKAVPTTMLQLEAYGRNLRTAITTTTSPVIQVQPVHEVWALYPLNGRLPGDYSKNAFNLRLMDFSPAASTSHISKRLAALYTTYLR